MKHSIERIRKKGRSSILRKLANRMDGDEASSDSSSNGKLTSDEELVAKEATVHNEDELQGLAISVEEIVVVSNCCNDSELRELDWSRFVNLRELQVGDDCFANVSRVELIGLYQLERVVVGQNCFTKKKNDAGNDPDGQFNLKNCERVRELRIGRDSFADYAVCEIENVNRLEVIEMGEQYGDNSMFAFSSLELKSTSRIME